jgi:2-keto-4-pentenoate hydratase/2-oxohepta-3-ene-1,7-dioic acid hydratase in catechol pathway
VRIIRFVDGDGQIIFGEDLGDGTAEPLAGSGLDPLRRMRRRVHIGKLLAPIVPSAIICVGRNFAMPAVTRQGDHTLEVFLKPLAALQHPDEPIRIPRFDGVDPQLDCEGELAVVLAREARNLVEGAALDHVLGYTIANDVTARAFQTLTGPPMWMRGKGFDGFCPLGPAIVTRDAIPDPQNLTLRTVVNGVVKREGSTRDMLWSVAEIIACLSRHITLPAGAVILTGAPPLLAPFEAIAPGATIAIEIEPIGRLANRVAVAM